MTYGIPSKYASLNQPLPPSALLNADKRTGYQIALAEKARLAKLTGKTDYRRLRSESTRSARDDRNAYCRQIVTYMEQAASVGDSRKLYQLLKSSRQSGSSVSKSIRSREGEVITSLNSRMDRWCEHFSEPLHHQPPSSSPDQVSSIATQTYNCSLDPLLQEG